MNVSRSALLAALTSVAGVVKDRVTNPILSTVLLSCDGERLSLTGTDQVLTLSTRVPATGALDAVCVSASTILGWVKSSGGSDVVAVTVDPKGKLTAKIGSTTGAFPTLAAADYPGPAPVKLDEPLVFRGSDLASALEYVGASIAPPDNRYGLCGVHVEAAGAGLIRFVSTDGNRLAYDDCAAAGELPHLGKMLITDVAIKVIAQMAAASGAGEVSLEFDPRIVVVRAGDTTLTARLLEADFPDYRQVLPKDHKREVKVPRAELAAALKSVMPLAGDATCTVKMVISDDGIKLSTRKLDAGEATADVNAVVVGEKITMAVNGRYLTDALARAGGDTVTLRIGDVLSPMLIPSADEQGLTVLMPVRLD